jgi:CheY-like chemotaxis protein
LIQCQRRLQAAGYRVHGTTNPLEAAALIERDPNAFDLVITDFTMPQMTGEDLARRVTAVREGMPIILVTGSVPDFPRQRSQRRVWTPCCRNRSRSRSSPPRFTTCSKSGAVRRSRSDGRG